MDIDPLKESIPALKDLTEKVNEIRRYTVSLGNMEVRPDGAGQILCEEGKTILEVKGAGGQEFIGRMGIEGISHEVAIRLRVLD